MTDTLPGGGVRTIGTGYTHVVWNNADCNAATALDTIDLFELAEVYGLRQTASLQAVTVSGTIATRVIILQWSNDGGTWNTLATIAAAATTSASINVKGYRYLRVAVTTQEGAASLAHIHLVLTGDNR